MPTTAYEQLMVELLNRARLDPTAEAARLGIELNSGLTTTQIAARSYQPLAVNEQLRQASVTHSRWMLENESVTHSGAQGSNAGDRIAAAHYDLGGDRTWSENISFRASSGQLDRERVILQQHEQLFTSALHRLNMFRSNAREVGVGQAVGDFDGYNASLVTQKFVASNTSAFLTGVAYTDRDGDDFYSIGEGRSGVGLTVGGRSETTSTSGGYEIALSALGQQIVRVETAAGTMAVKLNFKGENVKFDLTGARDVSASTDMTLLGGLYNGTLLGTRGLSLTGNYANNHLTGNSGNNSIHSGSGSDHLKGGAGRDSLYGEDGRDYLSGGSGSDTLSGGAGNDVLAGGSAGDRISGGYGLDLVSYAGSTAAVNVSISSGRGHGGHAEGDVLLGVEGIIGSNFGDTLSGGGGANRLYGGEGEDVLSGGSGSDTIIGGAGSDRILSGAGADRISGGHGFDTLDYASAKTRIVVDLTTGSGLGHLAGGDRFYGVEAVNGSAYGDRLIGNSSANRLAGNAGNDVLSGRDGDDTLDGGAGHDQLIGGAGSDSFVFFSPPGHDHIRDFDAARDSMIIGSDLLGADGLAGLQVSEVSGDTVFTFDGGGSVTLDNVVGLSDLSFIQIL